MSRKGGKDSLTAEDHAGQDGGRTQRSDKEAAMKLFAKTPGKDNHPRMPSLTLAAADQELLPVDPETVWPEDSEAAPTWDTVGNAAPTDTAKT